MQHWRFHSRRLGLACVVTAVVAIARWEELGRTDARVREEAAEAASVVLGADVARIEENARAEQVGMHNLEAVGVNASAAAELASARVHVQAGTHGQLAARTHQPASAQPESYSSFPSSATQQKQIHSYSHFRSQ